MRSWEVFSPKKSLTIARIFFKLFVFKWLENFHLVIIALDIHVKYMYIPPSACHDNPISKVQPNRESTIFKSIAKQSRTERECRDTCSDARFDLRGIELHEPRGA